MDSAMKQLLLVLLTCACTSPSFYVYSEPRLTDPTAVAIGAWNTALLRGPCPELQLYPSEDKESKITISAGPGLGRMAFEANRRITVDLEQHAKTNRSGDVATTIAHEIGHALGARRHSTHEDDLMYSTPPARRGPMPTGYDVAKVCASWWGK